MLNKLTQLTQGSVTRHRVRVVAFAVLGASIGAILAMQILSPDVGVHDDLESKGDIHASATTAYTLADSKPTTISIPSIGVKTVFESPLGLNTDQTIEVPDSFEEVGWYKNGPTPGELGPAVVLGHVDSYQGPAVFFSIGQLEPGDPIIIDREDGTTATFEVTGLERYEQEGFPTELVYGDLDFAGLRLVTCSGTFDKGVQKYSHNTVVYAALVEPDSD